MAFRIFASNKIRLFTSTFIISSNVGTSKQLSTFNIHRNDKYEHFEAMINSWACDTITMSGHLVR